jgi:hypothetical protein
VAQRLASPSDITSGLIEEAKPPAADVDLLLGSAEEVSPRLPLEHTLYEGAACVVNSSSTQNSHALLGICGISRTENGDNDA